MNSEKKIIPLRRFPEFIQDDGWKESNFENTFSFLPNNTLSRAELKEGKGDVYNIHYGDVLIKLNAYTDIQLRKLPAIKNINDISRYKNARLQDGDIVIADTAEDETVGKCTEIVNTKETMVVSGLHTIPCRPKMKFAQAFLGYYMNSSSFHNKLRPIMQGVKVTSISKTALQNIYLTFPKSLEEQQKIADCLSSIDSYISSINEKIEQLKAHKKSLMQKLFPKNGQTVPEYRFPEYVNGNEWEEKKVAEIFTITRGRVLAASLTRVIPDDVYCYPVYSSQTTNNGLMGFYNEALFEDAITWTTDGANAGTVRFRKGKFFCTNVCGVLLNEKGYANEFIAAFLNTKTKQYVSLVGNPKLMNNVMAEISICIPNIPEQKKLAACLYSIDKLIIANSYKIVLLEQEKIGLMQLLFPKS